MTAPCEKKWSYLEPLGTLGMGKPLDNYGVFLG